MYFVNKVLKKGYQKEFRDLLKQVVTFDVFKEIGDPKTIKKWRRKFHVGLFTGLLTGLFTLLWRSLTDFFYHYFI